MSTPFDTPVAHFTRNKKDNKLPFLKLEDKTLPRKLRSFSERLANSNIPSPSPAENQLENCRFNESFDQLRQEFVDDIFSQTISFTERINRTDITMAITYANLISRIDRKIPEYKGT